MTKYIVAFVLVALFVLLVGLAMRAWSSRRTAQEALFSAPLTELANFKPAESAKGFYVATTVAGEPLNRVAAHGLGARGRVEVFVSDQGVLLERLGERDLAIKSEDVLNVTLVDGAIDRIVESGGLLAILWQSGSQKLETTLRIVDEHSRSEILKHLRLLTTEGKQ